MGYTPHVLVIGGGAVGTGIARDLAIRGLEVTLVERGSLASGSTARSRGLLYSGAQFAEVDPSAARRCLAENRTLFEIANHCITDTGGLIVDRDGNDEAFDQLRAACDSAGIPTSELSADELTAVAPALADECERALRVPDAVIDPFELTLSTARDAAEYGAAIRTHTAVTDITVEGGTVEAVELTHDPLPSGPPTPATAQVDDAATPTPADADEEQAVPSEDDDSLETDGGEDRKSLIGGVGDRTTPGQVPGTVHDETGKRPETSTETIEPDFVVNAAGDSVTAITDLAGLSLPLERSTETVVVTDDTPVDIPITGVGDGDRPETIVPFDTHCLMGSDTAEPSPAAGRAPAAIDRTIEAGSQLVPALESAHPLRAFSSTQYTVRGNDVPAAHGQDFVLVDHDRHHDCWGLVTVLGASVTIHRHVAEAVADHVCEQFGISRPCQTDELLLPGAGDPDATPANDEESDDSPVLCEWRSVTSGAVEAAREDEFAAPTNLDDVRIRTRATMGRCQGQVCGPKLATTLSPEYDRSVVEDALFDLLAGRWAGQQPVAWGDRLHNLARMYALHTETVNPTVPIPTDLSADDFDDGRPTTTTVASVRGSATRRAGGTSWNQPVPTEALLTDVSPLPGDDYHRPPITDRAGGNQRGEVDG